MPERQENPLLRWADTMFQGGGSNIEVLINRVRAMPGLADWAPDGYAVQVTQLFALGMILGRVDDPSFQPLITSISETLRQSGLVKRDDEAELIVAAIVRPWCNKVIYVPRSKNERSQDLLANLDECDVEIEVTTAMRKDEQERRNKIASKLQNKLRAMPLDRHIDVHFLDSLTDDEEHAIFESASQLDIGQSVESENRWHLAIAQPNTSGLFTIGQAVAPSWFPNQHATPASFSSTFSTGTEKIVAASAQVRWGLSTKSYLNPLSKKAERSQGSNQAPFVIAMDVGRLPGAAKWYEETLPGFWKLWPHISGVLLFFGPAWAGEVLMLTYSLLRNPHSEYALPENWSSGRWDERLA